MSADAKLRIDKYLWAIRIFKTRSLATEACKNGKVKLGGQALKAAHVVKVGEVYHIHKGTERKVVEVKDLLERRVDAPTAQLFYIDLTPAEDQPGKMPSVFTVPVLKRDKGTGRPTKRERREIDKLQEGEG